VKREGDIVQRRKLVFGRDRQGSLARRSEVLARKSNWGGAGGLEILWRVDCWWRYKLFTVQVGKRKISLL